MHTQNFKKFDLKNELFKASNITTQPLENEYPVFFKYVCINYFSVGSVYESDCESNDSEGPSVESKFKSIASQCCGVLASDSLKFTTSTFLGFHILLIAELIKELHENNLEMPVTLNEITWIGK